MCRLAVWLLVVPVCIPSSALGQEWKVGIATVKITPEEPVRMAGYASRTKPFAAVNDDLYAKALARIIHSSPA